MGIFSRFKDIITANIGAMLEKSEDPEAVLSAVIREMEDTLVRIKASCAGAIAQKRAAEKRLEEIGSRVAYWEEKARIAVQKGRDDLAEEALSEKLRISRTSEPLQEAMFHYKTIVDNYKEDIFKIEEKLKNARERQSVLFQRRIHAGNIKQARQELRKFETSEAVMKFDELESRVQLMEAEAEAETVNIGTQSPLDEELERIEAEHIIEKELRRLKASQNNAKRIDIPKPEPESGVSSHDKPVP